ncbi:MAG: YwaF family protein [Clostridia bacterium]|nr:YwaF family protein [Clostridia bacterium]
MLDIFFSAPGTAEPCGLFTVPHIIGLIICAILIGVALFFSRNLSKKAIRIITLVMAIVFTVMEIIKITYKFINGDTVQLDHWFPLAFCSLFIYVLWMCALGKGIVYKLGCAFMCGGCFVGGLAFLIMPLTSLQSHPIYHFLSIHSMLFHSCMIYMSFMYIVNREFNLLDLKNFKYYALIVGPTCAISAIINVVTYLIPNVATANIMLLRHLPLPATFPIQWVYDLVGQLEFPFNLYTVCASLVYTTVPYFVNYGIVRLVKLINVKRSVKKTKATN